jgi:ABC-type multidrug transport system fused ATPase/permease subunit
MKANRWPGEYHRPPKPAVELYPEFDDTIAGKELDETVRNLRVLRELSHSDEEEKRYQFEAFQRLTDLSKEHSDVIAKIIASLKLKQSKSTSAEFEAKLTAKIEKRVDNIFKLVGALGVLFAIILAVIGWGHKG